MSPYDRKFLAGYGISGDVRPEPFGLVPFGSDEYCACMEREAVAGWDAYEIEHRKVMQLESEVEYLRTWRIWLVMILLFAATCTLGYMFALYSPQSWSDPPIPPLYKSLIISLKKTFLGSFHFAERPQVMCILRIGGYDTPGVWSITPYPAKSTSQPESSASKEKKANICKELTQNHVLAGGGYGLPGISA